jgi:LemA protein
VENQYQRRADLIPNLVNTVKGVADFEKETYTAVTEARAKAGEIKLTADMLNDPQAMAKFQAAQDGLSSALSRLLVTVEKYPELKANENFLQLQAQLEGTENRISVERKKFNEVVKTYNTTIKRFPMNVIANFTGFLEKQYFKAVAGSEQAPKVEF